LISYRYGGEKGRAARGIYTAPLPEDVNHYSRILECPCNSRYGTSGFLNHT